MATRTAKGEFVYKVTDNTIVGADITCADGDSLIVGIMSKTTQVPNTVTWGAINLSKVGQRIHDAAGFTLSVWQLRVIYTGGTEDITALWGNTPDVKVMIALTLDAPHKRDEIARAIFSSSNAPTVGPTSEHLRRDDFIIGFLGAEGPLLDDAPIVATAATGQRAGSAGVPPVSNLTLNEFYLQSTTSSGVTIAGSSTTSRDWICVEIAFRVIPDVPTDINGSAIDVGDSVLYEGSYYEVLDTVRANNKVILETVGMVAAIYVEVRN